MKYIKFAVNKPALTGCFVGFAIIGAIYLYGFSAMRITSESIRDMIVSLGYWGPSLYILCNIIRPFLFFPAIVLGVAGGLSFGPLWGAAYLIIGTALGAALCFGVARILGRDRLKRSWPKWIPLEELDNQAARHGFRTVLLIRLAPVLPWDVVSFMAGLSEVRFWPYFSATIIGSIPGAVAFSYMGHALSQSLVFVAIGIAITIMYLIYCFTQRKTIEKGCQHT